MTDSLSQLDSDEEEFRDAARQIRAKKAAIKKISQEKNTLQNRPIIPKNKKKLYLSDLTSNMRKAGHDPRELEKRAARLAKENDKINAERKKAMAAQQAAEEEAGGMDVDMDEGDAPSKNKKRGVAAADRAPRTKRQYAGLATNQQSDKANELRMFAQRLPNRLAKASESDRHVPITRPKWMLSGKRKGGTTDRR